MKIEICFAIMVISPQLANKYARFLRLRSAIGGKAGPDHIMVGMLHLKHTALNDLPIIRKNDIIDRIPAAVERAEQVILAVHQRRVQHGKIVKIARIEVADQNIRFLPLQHLGNLDKLRIPQCTAVMGKMGIEKVILKQERLSIFFTRTNDKYWQSDIFGKIVEFVMMRPQRCRLQEDKDRQGKPTGRRYATIQQVKTISGALTLLNKILTGRGE
jgi:hypothetical protein